MRSALIIGCLTLLLIGPPSTAHARRGGRGRGAGRYAAAMWKVGMAQMKAMAAQEQYLAAQRAAAHQKQVAVYSDLREKELAKIEARRQERLASQGK